MQWRKIQQVVPGQGTMDGAGVRLRRTVGSRLVDHVDPFLLLDEFRSDAPTDYIAGFPDHPHRGFETVTYMLEGQMEHRDHAGQQGLLVPGGAQWMTAGRGIIHSEMPKQQDGLMWGFQLWVNLPAAHKMDPPRYQDIEPGQIPEVSLESGLVRVIAGELQGTHGPVRDIVTAPTYWDVRLNAGASFEAAIPARHNAMVYVYKGALEVAGPPLVAGHLGILADGDGIQAKATESAGFLLLAAQPIGEPIVRYGPFVMNTEAEIVAAIDAYRRGELA